MYQGYVMPQQSVAINSFISRVYSWMAFALLITATVSALTVSSPTAIGIVATNPIVFYGLVILELILVFVLALAVQNLSPVAATAIFIGYAVLNGVTLSLLYLIYTAGSLASTFLITSLTFGVMSIYGYTTKRDLTSFGNLLLMALIGIIIASVINIFFKNPFLYWATTYLGILIFVGLIAYDSQRIKNMSTSFDLSTPEGQKYSILGALALYLDLINLFLLLLRVLGQRKE